MGEMSAERMYAGKRKASDGTLDSENVGFWAKSKPVVTARRCRPACNERLLEFKAYVTVDIEGEANLVTEHVDVGILGSYFSTQNVDIGVDSMNLTDGEEGCETPKCEEYRIPKIVTCPPAPRKRRPTARRRTESETSLSGALFVSPSDINFLFELRPATKKNSIVSVGSCLRLFRDFKLAIPINSCRISTGKTRRKNFQKSRYRLFRLSNLNLSFELRPAVRSKDDVMSVSVVRET